MSAFAEFFFGDLPSDRVPVLLEDLSRPGIQSKGFVTGSRKSGIEVPNGVTQEDGLVAAVVNAFGVKEPPLPTIAEGHRKFGLDSQSFIPMLLRLDEPAHLAKKVTVLREYPCLANGGKLLKSSFPDSPTQVNDLLLDSWSLQAHSASGTVRDRTPRLAQAFERK